MRFQVGSRVKNVRRPDVIGTVISLEGKNNKYMVRPEDMRIIVRYPRVTRTSNGKWKGGELDELPADLVLTGEKIHPAFTENKRNKKEIGVYARIKTWDANQVKEQQQ